MKKPLVSVIIPIYNGEQAIERCLCSIRNQTYHNIEVIVVNDGSTDHTEAVLRKYEKMDCRFQIIEKENTGVSDSRNIAMHRAKGKYFQFVDGDDWMKKDAIERLVTIMLEENCDMVITDYYRVRGKKIREKEAIADSGLISRQEYAQCMMEAPANFYYGVLWNKFFKADMIRRGKLKCSEELSWCEDFQFNLEYLQFVKNVYVLKTPFYYYVKTKGSLVDTQINFRQTIRTKRILFEYYKDLYKSIDLYNENKLRIQMFYLAVARDREKKTPRKGKAVC